MDPDKWMELSARRNEVIEKAVEAADRIILDGSDGSVEETNYLTAEVTRKLVKRVLYHFQREILRKDTMESQKG